MAAILRFALYTSLLLYVLSAAHGSKCLAADACVSALSRGERCIPIQVPLSAVPPTLPQEGFLLVKLRYGVYSVRVGPYLMLVLYHNRRLIVIDFPAILNQAPTGARTPLEAAVIRVIGSSTPRRIDMVYSHRHLDHIAGALRFHTFARHKFPDARLVVWGSKQTARFIRTGSGSMPPIPTAPITHKWTVLHVSRALSLRLRIVAGHTEDDVLAHVPPTAHSGGVAHLVDFITPGFAPFLRFSLATSLREWLSAHDALLSLPIAVFSGGHGRLGNKIDISRSKAYGISVIAALRSAQMSASPEEVARVVPDISKPGTLEFSNNYLAFRAQLDFFGDKCFATVVKEWGCTLGGVVTVARSHCDTVFFANVLE